MTGFELIVAACLTVLVPAVAWMFFAPPDAPPTSAKLADLEARIDSLFKLRLEWQTVQEGIEDALETVERKRRRAAASAAKVAGAMPPELAEMLAGAGATSGHPLEAPASHISTRTGDGAMTALRARARAAGRL